MPAQPFDLQLGRARMHRTLRVLILVNALFALSTAAFILLWERLHSLSSAGQWIVRNLLIQGHLATENVLAAWYSSMLLLAVALLALAAFAADGQRGAGWLRSGWLLLAGAFGLLSLDEIGSLHERLGMMPALSPSGRAVGWVDLLAIPIVLVGVGMIAFAWSHVRSAPRAFALMTGGVALFLSNPLLEIMEMRLLQEGAGSGSWQMALHNGLLVLEEGGVELFGILMFLSAVVSYLWATRGEAVQWMVAVRARLWAARGLTLLSCLGAVAAAYVGGRLPGGDPGVPQNWFPAAGWLLVGCYALQIHGGITAIALALSAFFGAGLYTHTGIDALGVPTSSAAWQVPVAGALAAGVALEVVIRVDDYFFRRSPRSSTASPTLRRPRPNPS